MSKLIDVGSKTVKVSNVWLLTGGSFLLGMIIMLLLNMSYVYAPAGATTLEEKYSSGVDHSWMKDAVEYKSNGGDMWYGYKRNGRTPDEIVDSLSRDEIDKKISLKLYQLEQDTAFIVAKEQAQYEMRIKLAEIELKTRKVDSMLYVEKRRISNDVDNIISNFKNN